MKQFSDLSPSAERIVDAGEGLIQTVGYNGFSFDHVAKIVGIRKPSVHHHFATKAELGAVIVQRYTHRFKVALLGIEGQTSSSAQRLQAYAQLFEQTYEQSRRLCLCGMLGAEADSLPEEVRVEVHQFFRVNIAWLTEVFQSGLTQQELSAEAPAPALAESYMSLLEGGMLVGRGLPSAQGPLHAAKVFMASLTRGAKGG